jgi:hypothetical protein
MEKTICFASFVGVQVDSGPDPLISDLLLNDK